MTTSPAPADPVMETIGEAITAGRAGDTESARTKLLSLWETIGPVGDPLHRCTLAHYLADLYDDPAQALTWDVRALDAVGALTEDRAQRHHASLHVAGFSPSLHLNLADNYRRLGSFQAAGDHIAAARQHAPNLPDGAYGDQVRTAIDEVAEAITNRATHKRPSAPGPTA